MPTIETNLQTIALQSLSKQAENDAFTLFLKSQDSNTVDALVAEINNTISPKINCLDCGNCCKTLMINVSEEEALTVSQHLQISIQQFEDTYVEKGSSMMVINAIPCHFLNDKSCTIYEKRFEGCREFPALHMPKFTNRLFTTFMHYERCPIIYNVMEQLKFEMGFYEV